MKIKQVPKSVRRHNIKYALLNSPTVLECRILTTDTIDLGAIVIDATEM